MLGAFGDQRRQRLELGDSGADQVRIRQRSGNRADIRRGAQRVG
jgi:hypothetical protein